MRIGAGSGIRGATLVASMVFVGCVSGEKALEEPEPVTQELRERTLELGLAPMIRPELPRAQVELGRMLFFDPIMSGNKDFACSGCHRMDRATVDGLSLPVGTKGVTDEFGERRPGVRLNFVPRNVPDLFNRGHPEVRSMFWDKRMEQLDDGRIVLYDFQDAYAPNNVLRAMDEIAPLEGRLENMMAAQAMMPVLNRDELRGAPGDEAIDRTPNELALTPDADLESVWVAAMSRYRAIPEYVELFERAYPGTSIESMDFTHAANAISAFVVDSFTLTESPWDRFLRGDDSALNASQKRGAMLFFGRAQCSRCHSGDLLSDQQFYNLAVVPLGRGPDPYAFVDRGAAHRSHADRTMDFSFRTPPLRNVELTAPYMHNGTYTTLEAVIRHKNDALSSLWSYDEGNLTTMFARQLHRSQEVLERVESTVEPLFSTPLGLSDDDIDDLVSFLRALTDPRARDLTDLIPESVPSGLRPIVLE